MVRADVVRLIGEATAHGVHESTTENEREVLVEVRSVTRSEYYNALNAGVQPELVFKLALDADYQDEHFLKHNGTRYRVVRTYLTNDGGIEITAERSDENGTDEEQDTDNGDG
jgi:SPP1 family predicted phage head-tail adaptor